MAWLTDNPCVVHRGTLAFCHFLWMLFNRRVLYWHTKENVKATYWYKMFPGARGSFPGPEFIFLRGITRHLILFLTLFPVLLERLNGLDSLFEFRECKLRCGTWWWKYYLGRSTMPNLSQSRQSPKALVHHRSLEVEGRIPSQLLGRSADAATPHKCALPGLLHDIAAFH